jgi:hypothetical protein
MNDKPSPAPIHPKTMPVILTTDEERDVALWRLTKPAARARIAARGGIYSKPMRTSPSIAP